jgi:hypothetical protein
MLRKANGCNSYDQVKSTVPFSEPYVIDPSKPPPEKDYEVYFKELKGGITGKEALQSTPAQVWSMLNEEAQGTVPFGEPYVIDLSNPPPEKDYELYFKEQWTTASEVCIIFYYAHIWI